MLDNFSIVGISGSLRTGSHNTNLLRAASSIAPTGVEIQLADISDVPLYNDDIFQAGFPASIERLREDIRRADAVLIATPEYNGAVPGVLKNALDWISRPPHQPFSEKHVGIFGGSPGRLGTVRAQANLRAILNAMGAFVVPKPEVYIGRVSSVVSETGFTDDKTAEYVVKLLASLRSWSTQNAPHSSELPSVA